LPKSKSLFFSKANCGLPIGNLTSQLFSNIYLHSFDTFIKNENKIKYYSRYVDDFYILSNNASDLKEYIMIYKENLENELGLQLHPKKIILQHFSKGVNFLGATLKPHRKYVSNRAKINFKLRVKNWKLFSQNNTLHYADAQASAAVTGKQNTLTNSAGLAGALSDETGTGLAVFATSPVLDAPNLGTPTALVGTNITGTASVLSIGGNAATATTATKLSGGAGGSIPYQIATGNTGMLANGTAGQVLQSNGSTQPPSWVSGAAVVREVADEFLSGGAETSFTLTQTKSSNSEVKMYINGVRISNSAYSINGLYLIYNNSQNGNYVLVAGDRIQVDYYY
jgi:hypothetical protein